MLQENIVMFSVDRSNPYAEIICFKLLRKGKVFGDWYLIPRTFRYQSDEYTLPLLRSFVMERVKKFLSKLGAKHLLPTVMYPWKRKS